MQRVALARAQVREPKVLLLDEATSNLDLHTEAAIWSSLSAARGKRTTVFVTHRLQSSRVADRIVVLHEGRIAETGAFGELMANRGRYYEL